MAISVARTFLHCHAYSPMFRTRSLSAPPEVFVDQAIAEARLKEEENQRRLKYADKSRRQRQNHQQHVRDLETKVIVQIDRWTRVVMNLFTDVRSSSGRWRKLVLKMMEELSVVGCLRDLKVVQAECMSMSLHLIMPSRMCDELLCFLDVRAVALTQLHKVGILRPSTPFVEIRVDLGLLTTFAYRQFVEEANWLMEVLKDVSFVLFSRSQISPLVLKWASDITVLQIKLIVRRSWKIPIEQQSVRHTNRVLEEGTLAKYDIQAGSCLCIYVK